jgi:hypothetical protein
MVGVVGIGDVVVLLFVEVRVAGCAELITAG